MTSQTQYTDGGIPYIIKSPKEVVIHLDKLSMEVRLSLKDIWQIYEALAGLNLDPKEQVT